MINTGRDDAIFEIGKVEARYNAKWVAQLPLRDRRGNWMQDQCADVYYTAEPHPRGSHYFGLFYSIDGVPFITNAASAVEGIITAVEAEDGEIIYSRYTHDYRTSKDGTAFIDGGRSYTKTNMNAKFVDLKVVDGELVKI